MITLKKTIATALSIVLCVTLSLSTPAASGHAWADGEPGDESYLIGFVQNWFSVDRYSTAKNKLCTPNDGVIVVSGENFPDTLSASGLAGLLDYGICYVQPTSLRDDVRDRINAGNVSNVIVIGGTSAVSDEVFNEIASLSNITSVTRIAGADRFATSEAVYRYGQSVHGWSSDNAVVVSGTGFADAASIAVFAAGKAAPVFLADADGNISDTTLARVQGYDRVLIAGGEAVVSAKTYNAIDFKTEVVRLGGEDRYETSAKIVDYITSLGDVENGKGEFSYKWLYVATGKNYPDALAVGVNEAIEQRDRCYRAGNDLNNCPVVMLADNGQTSQVTSQLTSVGSYCDEAKSYQRFENFMFIGPDIFTFETEQEIIASSGCPFEVLNY